MEFEIYQPVAVGFVFDLTPQSLAEVKKKLVSACQCLEADDRAYVFYLNDLEVPRWQGQIVARIANYAPFDLPQDCVKTTLHLVANSLPVANRYLFYFCDSMNDKNKHRINSGIKINQKYDYGFKIIVVTTNDVKSEGFEVWNLDNLTQKIKQELKGSDV